MMTRPQVGCLGEYEAWLDQLDRHLFVEKGVIHCEFDKPLRFAFAEYKDIVGLKQCAARLRSALRDIEPELPREYLVRRLLTLGIQRSRIHTSVDFLMEQLRAEWGIKDLSD
jgi:hypothetical protein